jgi:hypothetical protein
MARSIGVDLLSSFLYRWRNAWQQHMACEDQPQCK